MGRAAADLVFGSIGATNAAAPSLLDVDPAPVALSATAWQLFSVESQAEMAAVADCATVAKTCTSTAAGLVKTGDTAEAKVHDSAGIASCELHNYRRVDKTDDRVPPLHVSDLDEGDVPSAHSSDSEDAELPPPLASICAEDALPPALLSDSDEDDFIQPVISSQVVNSGVATIVGNSDDDGAHPRVDSVDAVAGNFTSSLLRLVLDTDEDTGDGASGS